MKPFLLQSNSQKHSTSQTKHSSDGKKMEKSRLKKQNKDIEGTSMMCQTSHRPKIVRIIKKHHSSMQGSHQQNKKMTLKDKLNSYNPNIQIIQLSKTLDQASTSNEEDSLPFWMRSLSNRKTNLYCVYFLFYCFTVSLFIGSNISIFQVLKHLTIWSKIIKKRKNKHCIR